MNGKEILSKTDFQKCLDFHGHLCPGLSTGYLASIEGMKRLSAQRSEDEEIVAIVETDACGTDAVQVITGCTFGKGNFIYRDYGKTAFTFFSRQTGKGVRLARRAETTDSLTPEHRALITKIRQETATEEERKRFSELHEEESYRLLSMQPEQLFTITDLVVPLPEKAMIEPSVLCDYCKEPTMASKLTRIDEQMICRSCSSTRFSQANG